jgi:hypothetical protein
VAVARNRDALQAITRGWVRAFPNDAEALEAHATVLETMGLIRRAGPDERSALAMIVHARRVAPSGDQALHLAVMELRLLLKLEESATARILADSLLDAFGDSAPPSVAGPLARVAVLTGHVFQGAKLLPRSEVEDSLRTSTGLLLYAPPPVLEGSLALLVYSAAGGPVDSIKAIQERIELGVRRLVESKRREVVLQAALDLPTALTFPLIGAGPVHRRYAGGLWPMDLQWSLMHGDTSVVRASLAGVLQQARDGPGDVTIDFAYQFAELALAIGDSATALELIGAPLDALQASGTDLLEFVAETGGFVRAMALRAELAARTGDQGTAREWASAVVTLWSNADAPLQPVVERMRALGGTAQGRR